MTESQSKGLPDEPFGQYLAGLSRAEHTFKVSKLSTQPNNCCQFNQLSTMVTKICG